MNLLNIGGRDPRSGSLFNYIETYGGGQGALVDRDGTSAVQNHMTNTRNAPVEAIESTYPLLVRGMKRIIEILGDRVTLTLSSDRFELAPWGIFGGGSALPGSCIMVRPEGSEDPVGSKVTGPVEKGSRLNIVTPGGGGRDNPYERAPESVRQDVVDGLLSTQTALDGYGVVFNQDLTVNEAGTAAQRLKTRSEG
jgi:N-methylhydantoinase B